jgi:hypothetical protein
MWCGVGYRRFDKTYFAAFMFKAVLLDCLNYEGWTIKVVLKRRHISTNKGCLTAQKTEDFIYTTAQAANLLSPRIINKIWLW